MTLQTKRENLTLQEECERHEEQMFSEETKAALRKIYGEVPKQPRKRKLKCSPHFPFLRFVKE